MLNVKELAVIENSFYRMPPEMCIRDSPNGVQRMSQSMKGLVETSNNLAIVSCKNGKFEAYNLTRSSVDTSKESTAWRIAAVFHLIGAKVTLSGSYPGWKPNMESPILKTMSGVCLLYTSIPSTDRHFWE